MAFPIAAAANVIVVSPAPLASALVRLCYSACRGFHRCLRRNERDIRAFPPGSRSYSVITSQRLNAKQLEDGISDTLVSFNTNV
jgi:hypothetical protein